MTDHSAPSLPGTDAGPSSPVRVRVAPSPTGDPHVGTAYMALFNLAFARRTGGTFLLRIEDTDQARFQADSEQQLFDTLRWLGLTWDEGPDIGGPSAPYRQSERLETYRPFVDQLIADGHAYLCWCTPERLTQMREAQQKAKRPTGYDRLCYGKTEQQRAELPGFSPTPVVRMLIPQDAPTQFTDVIRGQVNAPRPDDQVILKADGFPTYHLAVVVDDHLMGITHVVRGEEWISSTPKHLLLYRWLGWQAPQFAHMPLLRNQDKSKISKRKNPAARLTWFIEQGYLPAALVNFLSLLGYPPIIESTADADGEQHTVEREVFSFDEFAQAFDWNKVSPVGPMFDLKKLGWLNGVYIRAMQLDEFADALIPFAKAQNIFGPGGADPDERQLATLHQVAELIQTRISLLGEAADYLRPFFVTSDRLVVAEPARAHLKENTRQILEAAESALAPLTSWTAEEIEAAVRSLLIDDLALKPKVAFAPLRIAISGATISPPLFESMAILGKESTLARLNRLAADQPVVHARDVDRSNPALEPDADEPVSRPATDS